MNGLYPTLFINACCSSSVSSQQTPYVYVLFLFLSVLWHQKKYIFLINCMLMISRGHWQFLENSQTIKMQNFIMCIQLQQLKRGRRKASRFPLNCRWPTHCVIHVVRLLCGNKHITCTIFTPHLLSLPLPNKKQNC